MGRRGIIVAIFLLLLGVGWWMFLMSPRADELERLDIELTAARDAEPRLRAQITELEQVRDNEPAYLEAIELLQRFIPDDPQLDEIIDELRDMAIDNEVVLWSLSPGLPAVQSGDGNLRTIVVNARITGEFFRVVPFMFALTDLERVARVDAIAATRIGGAEMVDGDAGDPMDQPDCPHEPIEQSCLSVTLQIRFFTLSAVLPETLEPVPPILDDQPGPDGGVEEPPPGADNGDTDGDDEIDDEGEDDG